MRMVRRLRGILFGSLCGQEVEVYTVETDIHPAFDAELVMDDGMVIHISGGRGGVTSRSRATAVRVNDNVETAVQEIISADTKKECIFSHGL